MIYEKKTLPRIRVVRRFVVFPRRIHMIDEKPDTKTYAWMQHVWSVCDKEYTTEVFKYPYDCLNKESAEYYLKLYKDEWLDY